MSGKIRARSVPKLITPTSISWFRQRTHITKVLGSPLGRHQPGPQAPVPTPHPTVPQNSPRLSRAPQTKRKKIYLLRSRRKSPRLSLALSRLHGRPGARGSAGPGQEEEALQGMGANCSRASPEKKCRGLAPLHPTCRVLCSNTPVRVGTLKQHALGAGSSPEPD